MADDDTSWKPPSIPSVSDPVIPAASMVTAMGVISAKAGIAAVSVEVLRLM